jgi:hypothetical protein
LDIYVNLFPFFIHRPSLILVYVKTI